MTTTFILAAALAISSSARADTFDFSYTGAGVTASGILTTSTLGGGGYTILGITGTRNGATITGLSTFEGADNLLLTAEPFVDDNGIAFTTGTDSYSLFLSSYSGEFGEVIEEDSEGTDIAITLDPIATPEPSSLILMGSGILAMAGASRRKLRTL